MLDMNITRQKDSQIYSWQ